MRFLSARQRFVFCVGLVSISQTLFGQPDGAQAETIKVDNGSVTFEAPPGFAKLTQELIDLKYPATRRPTYVIGNASASTTIAYDLKPHVIPNDKLDDVRKSFTTVFNRVVPGIQWKKNEILKHAGREWVHFEMTSNAVDTDIHNIMLVTGHNGKMLVFNFNSTKEDFPKYEKMLRASMHSIVFAP